MAWSICRTPGSRAKIYPWCMSWVFGAHSLWWDTLLSLDAAESGLALPQLGMPGLADSPLGGLTLSEESIVVESKGEQEKGREGEL